MHIYTNLVLLISVNQAAGCPDIPDSQWITLSKWWYEAHSLSTASTCLRSENQDTKDMRYPSYKVALHIMQHNIKTTRIRRIDCLCCHWFRPLSKLKRGVCELGPWWQQLCYWYPVTGIRVPCGITVFSLFQTVLPNEQRTDNNDLGSNNDLRFRNGRTAVTKSQQIKNK